ncbi:hypothetical protein SAMN02910317_00677 [Ruminococcaceae bacterium FB2012]|nr:hypothetical protein SAMN02910317_00677 [Ruminococcaceae bacterium FB2012]
MDYIKSAEIEKGLTGNGRVYLCGNLEKANGIQHIPTENYEIGISDYPVYTFEKAHIHSFNREYNYVLDGAIKIFMLNEKKEFLFEKGDLFILNVGEPYVGKCLAGTRTIFSKVPGGNDKVLVEMNKALLKWGESWESEYILEDEE